MNFEARAAHIPQIPNLNQAAQTLSDIKWGVIGKAYEMDVGAGYWLQETAQRITDQLNASYRDAFNSIGNTLSRHKGLVKIGLGATTSAILLSCNFLNSLLGIATPTPSHPLLDEYAAQKAASTAVAPSTSTEKLNEINKIFCNVGFKKGVVSTGNVLGIVFDENYFGGEIIDNTEELKDAARNPLNVYAICPGPDGIYRDPDIRTLAEAHAIELAQKAGQK
ncbi:hypothetical protein A3D78_00295 [Candidatus Gottesmanbacteria bacterium RIFCSPHIGHO2_02_FULL_39_14]|uniref:Uncharacterized protein n=1 Tax=Candidatus Gottesmanbacteria bacterium RIFCSPHIGHO2_02_FULL_39_14 TaxID=1798383 RepID=A0A1F5ZTV9_9BACT|nr:MAG: hypothetical protein A3D78_00295 [Candidatus Gottesmanbacteria bacterium RIFCSPHIGHO2_02_FULL_39_14]